MGKVGCQSKQLCAQPHLTSARMTLGPRVNFRSRPNKPTAAQPPQAWADKTSKSELLSHPLQDFAITYLTPAHKVDARTWVLTCSIC